jgi:hypothetical protein
MSLEYFSPDRAYPGRGLFFCHAAVARAISEVLVDPGLRESDRPI